MAGTGMLPACEILPVEKLTPSGILGDAGRHDYNKHQDNACESQPAGGY